MSRVTRMIGVTFALVVLVATGVVQAQTTPASPITPGNAAKVLDLHNFTLNSILPSAASLSPDGTHMAVASASADKPGIWMVDLSTPNSTPTFMAETNPVVAMAFSPMMATSSSNTFLATADNSGAASYFQASPQSTNAATMQDQTQLPVNAITVSHDGQMVATGTGDDSSDSVDAVTLWSASSGKTLLTETVSDPVTAVAFSPDGTMLAAADAAGGVHLWNLTVTKGANDITADATEATGYKIQSDAISSIAFSPDGNLIATGSLDDTLMEWDLSKNAVKHMMVYQPGSKILSVAFSPDGNLIAAGGGNPDFTSANNAVKVWNVNTALPVATLTGHTAEVGSVAFTPDGTQIVSVGADNMVRVWGLGAQ